MSHPPLPGPHDLINEPEAFDAEFERQLTLCLSGEPNRAREWSFAKLALALSAAESLLSDDLEPDLGPTRPLRETEKALKRNQIGIGRLFLTQLEHLRAGVRDPAIAAMFDTIAPLAITLGTVCHEVSPRTQEALGDQDHVRMRSADQAEIARRSANKRTQWMRDLMPVATGFLPKLSRDADLDRKADEV